MSKRRHYEGDFVNSLRQKHKVDQSMKDYYAKRTFDLLMQAQGPNHKKPIDELSFQLSNTDLNSQGESLDGPGACYRCSTNNSGNKCTFCEKVFCGNCTQICEVCNYMYCNTCSLVDYSASNDRVFCLSCLNP